MHELRQEQKVESQGMPQKVESQGVPLRSEGGDSREAVSKHDMRPPDFSINPEDHQHPPTHPTPF